MSKPFRIALLAASRTSGGGAVFIEGLVDSLSQQPDTTVIVLEMGTRVETANPWPEGVTVVPLEVPAHPIVRRLLVQRAVRRALRATDADVLLCPGTSVVTAPGTVSVFWPLTVAPLESLAIGLLSTSVGQKLRWRLLRHMLRRACSEANAIIYSSDYAEGLYRRTFASAQGKPYSVIRPAASINNIQTQVHTAIPNAQAPLLCVSHLYPYKMIRELILGFGEACHDVSFQRNLLIAGNPVDPTYERSIKLAIIESKLENRVHLLGGLPREDLINLYRDAWAFAFLSLSENAGSYALIDAFGAGLPILATKHSSMPWAIGEAAWFVDPFNVYEIGAAILRLNNDPSIHKSLAEASADRFSWYPQWTEIASRFRAEAHRLAMEATKPAI